MRILKLLALCTLLAASSFAQANTNFEFKGNFDFDNPEQQIRIHRFYDGGRRLLLVGHSSYQVWDVDNRKTLKTYPNPIGQTHRVSMLNLSPDLSKIIAFDWPSNTGEEDFLTVWDAATGEQLTTIDKDLYPVSAGFWSADSKTLITTSDVNFVTPYGYRFSPEGELVGNRVIEIKVAFWDAETLEHRVTLTLENLTWRYLSPDGGTLLTVSGPKRDVIGIEYASEKAEFIDVWNTRTGELTARLPIGDEVYFTRTRKLEVSPGGTYLPLIQKSRKRDSDDRILVWKIDSIGEISPEPLYEIKAAPEISDSDIRYSPDGRFMAVEAGRRLQIFELATGQKKVDLKETKMPSVWSDTVFLDIGLKKLKAYDIERDKKIYEQKLVYETTETQTGQQLTDVFGNDITESTTTVHDRSRFSFNLAENLYITYSNRFLEVFDLAEGRLIATLISPEYNFKKKKYEKDSLIKLAGWEPDGNLIFSINPGGTRMQIWKYSGS